MRNASILLALSLLLCACAAQRPDNHRSDPLVDSYGRLELVSARQRMVDDKMQLHVTVKNAFSEPVTGVRVLYRLLVNKEPDSPEIVRSQVESDAVVAPGAEAAVDIELPPQAGQRSGFGSFLQAFAVKRGGKALPLPPYWRTEND